MFFKKAINIIALLLFISFSIYFVIKTGKSISNLNPVSILDINNENFNLHNSTLALSIKPPIIIDNDNVFFKTTHIKDSEQINSLSMLNLGNFQISILNEFDYDFEIKGLAKENDKKLILISKDEESNIIIIEKDTIVKGITSQLPVKKNKLKSIAIVRTQPEIIAIDSLQDKYLRFTYSQSEKNWTERSVRDNPFFSRISTPLTAYYKNAWHFIATSRYHLKDGLFVFTPPKTSNLMLFRYDYSNHVEDIIVPLVIDSLKFGIDQTISGIFQDIDCQTTINVFNPSNSSLKQFNCLDKNNIVLQIFSTTENSIKRLIQLKNKTDNTLIISTEINKSIKNITQTFNEETNFTEYSYEDEIFAKTNKKQNEFYLIPFNDKTILLSSTAEYCVLDSDLNRIDSFGFFTKTRNTISNFIKTIEDEPINFRNLSLVAVIALYPALLGLSFFLFLIVKIFFTTKRPYYSKRKSNSHQFYSYLFFSSIIYIIGFAFSIFSFYEILKSI